MEAAGALKEAIEQPFAEYSDEERPLWPYTVLSGTFVAGLSGLLIAGKRSRGELPERIDAADLVLLGIASHKMSRLLTKDKVAAFLRAPFVEYQGSAGAGEVEERPRGTGVRRALGELLVCPYCMGEWVAGGLVGGLLVRPRLTRTLASVMAVRAISDFLQAAYLAAEKRA